MGSAKVHQQEGWFAPWGGWITAEVPGQSLIMCHPSVPWGSCGLGATLAHVLMSHTCSWGIPDTSNRSTSGYAQITSGAWELLHACSIPVLCVQWTAFYPFYTGEPLSCLHKITFGNHLPSTSMARLCRPVSVSSRVVALKNELCQDLVRVLQGWATALPVRWPTLGYPVVSLRNVSQCVLLGSLEALLYLCQVLVFCIIFPGMIQHLAQQPSRLCPCKDFRAILWHAAALEREFEGCPLCCCACGQCKGVNQGMYQDQILQNVLFICTLSISHPSSLLWSLLTSKSGKNVRYLLLNYVWL